MATACAELERIATHLMRTVRAANWDKRPGTRTLPKRSAAFGSQRGNKRGRQLRRPLELIRSRLISHAFECRLFGGLTWGRCTLQPIGRHFEKFVFQNRIYTALCVLDHFCGLTMTKIGKITLHGALLQACAGGSTTSLSATGRCPMLCCLFSADDGNSLRLKFTGVCSIRNTA
jgi:hypothetical protein